MRYFYYKDRSLSEHLVGILAGIVKSLQLGNNLGTVLGICHTKPLARGVEHLTGGLTRVDEMVHHQRNEELALEVGLILRVLQEIDEILLRIVEVVGSEAPEVHRNGSGVGNAYPLVVLIEILHHTVVTLYLGALHNRGQMMCLLVVLADTATHGAALGESVVNAETDHSILALAALGELAEELGHHLEGIAIVEVVAVEHSEGFLDDILTHEHSVVGAPGLLTAFGHSETGGKCVERLETEFAGNVTLILGENLLAEEFLEVATDHPYYFAEACLDGIVDNPQKQL